MTGGIGTYSRLLLELLDRCAPPGFTIAAFLGFPVSEELRKATPRVAYFLVGDEDPDFIGREVNNVGDAQDLHSLKLARRLERMSGNGHTFGLFEFPDYGSEAYFVLKSRRAGAVDIATIATRLHSPEMVLLRDNSVGPRGMNIRRRRIVGRELFCYRHSDEVFFGGTEMLNRVELEVSRYGLSIAEKSVHVEHPHPKEHVLPKARTKHEGDLRVGYIGRLEPRKGIVDFIEAVCASETLVEVVKRRSIKFELFGRDVGDENGQPNADRLANAAGRVGLSKYIRLHGALPQSQLWDQVAHMDGLIYPSRFENYPNALLETLPLGIPTLISSRGCMPHIASWSAAVASYDPFLEGATEAILAFLGSIDGSVLSDIGRQYRERVEAVHEGILSFYVSHGTRSNTAAASLSDAAPMQVAFVITHFNDPTDLAEALDSVDATKNATDEVVVVDDASTTSNQATAAQLALLHGAIFHRREANGGPAAARNDGVRNTTAPLIQFIDGDDTLIPSGVKYAREYLSRNPDVSLVCGGMRAFGEQQHIWWPQDGSAGAIEENYAHSAVLVRRSVYIAVGGQDSELRHHFEDWAFNCKVSLGGYLAEVVPALTLNYRVKPGSRTASNTEMTAESARRVIKASITNRAPVTSQLSGEMLDVLGMLAMNMTSGMDFREVGSALDYLARAKRLAAALRRRFPPGYLAIRWFWRRLMH